MAKAPQTLPETMAETMAETVKALTAIDHDGVRYEAGASIAMTPEQAAALYALGAAEPAAPAA